MKGRIYFSLLTLFLLLSAGCKESKKPASETAKYNPFIEAFTSGRISRFAPVYIVFNQDVPLDLQTAENARKWVSISPKVDGKFSFENNKVLVFTPSVSFERDKSYQVDADISHWFDTDRENGRFQFSFATVPAVIRGNWEALDLSTRPDAYNFRAVFYTSDRETPADVQSAIQFNHKGNAVWTHSPDGKKHLLNLHDVAATKQTEVLTAEVVKNKQGWKEEQIFAQPIPAAGEFQVYNITYKTAPERFVEVTFSQAIDRDQDLRGLAFINGHAPVVPVVEGNKLKLYPDQGTKGTMNVHINYQVRSQSGLQLPKDVITQVSMEDNLPAIRFTGNGVIIPQTDQLTIPFQAVNVRGVVVRVIKILQQNVGQFLQGNNMTGGSDLMQVGRPIARKTIFLDEMGNSDLSKWNTFSINLNQLIQPEPGAIYRIEMSFNRSLSAYPCPEGEEISKADLLAQDVLKFQAESDQFDEGGYYYYRNDMDWDDYDYKERLNPCSDSYYFSGAIITKNVLATNLGLIASAGEDGKMLVSVHNLLTTEPEKGVKIELFNYQRQGVGTGETGVDGRVTIEPKGGKPYYVVASQGTQRSYLRVDNGSALSLSSFDISGEVIQKGIKGFIYGDRGVWRPGDTLHLAFMLNDKQHTLPASHPVTLELVNPLGQPYLSKTSTRAEMGVYAFDMPTDPDVPTGSWTANVSVGGASFSKRLRVETIKPNRLKINLDFGSKVLVRNQPLDARLHLQWLQGAVAHNLKYDIQGTFISIPTTFAGYKEYCFDDPTKQFGSEESGLIKGVTDNEGNALIDARLEVGKSAPGMLAGNFVVKAYEESGDFSLDAQRVTYSPYIRYAGILPPDGGKKGRLDTGRAYHYKIAVVDYTGKPVKDVPAEVQVYKVYWYWWWSANREQLAEFMSREHNEPIRSFTVETDSRGQASFDFHVDREDWGTYLFTVRDKQAGGHCTGMMSYYDWPDSEGRRDMDGSDKAMQLNFKLDKEKYAPGEEMTVIFPSAAGGRAVVSVENSVSVLSVTEVVCQDGETTVKIPVTPAMQPNAYVHITLLQPHGLTKNDMPIRLYGVVPVFVDSPDSHLTPVVQAPDEIKPDMNYEIKVSEKSGREMAYTLAVVDEGLLDLTRFKTPDPWSAFNAREALGVRTWDLYNYVLGAYGGRIEQMFSIGGDDALNKGPKAIVNRFKPVVFFEGPFVLKKGEARTHRCAMPNYNGRVRVMVVAGDGSAYGHAEKSVLVRNPVMILGTLPRIIGVGEEMVVPVTVFATQDNIGDVQVSVATSDNVTIVGPAEQTVRFDKTGDKLVNFRVRVKDLPGVASVKLLARSSTGKASYDTDLAIRALRNKQVVVTPVTLQPGKEWQENIALPGLPGTNKVELEVGNVPPVNLSVRLDYLTNYPHACLEQLVSGAFPLLYVGEFTEQTDARKLAVQKKVKESIDRLRAYQMPDGAMSYWPGQSSSAGWATVYAGHFMFVAQNKGYLIPDALKRSWLFNQSKMAQGWKPVPGYDERAEEMVQAYRLYVLTLAQSAEVGAMNRLKENTRLTPVSRWFLAAAYVNIGKKEVGNRLITETTGVADNLSPSAYDPTFGSEYRDQAIQLQTLCLLGKGDEAASIARNLSAALSSNVYMSTQTTAYALIGLSQYMGKYKVSGSMDFVYRYGKEGTTIASPKSLWAGLLAEKADRGELLTLTNKTQSTLFARVIATGEVAAGDESPSSNGLELAVSYVDLSGKPVDLGNMAQGANFSAVVTVKNPTPSALNNLVLSQIFPSGWEILNTRFLTPDSIAAQPANVSYQDFRDDRVYSYIDLLPPGRQVTVKINLYAAYAGIFRFPATVCEAMYDELICANTAGREVIVKQEN